MPSVDCGDYTVVGMEDRTRSVFWIVVRRNKVNLREFSSQRHKIRYYHSLEGERKIEAFREMVDESGQIAFLGGAGVSTESGIPDFRSKNGLYRKADKRFSKYRPEYLLSSNCLYHKSTTGSVLFVFPKESGLQRGSAE